MKVAFENGGFSTRKQGATLIAGYTDTRYFDGSFSLDFHKMRWHGRKNFSLSVKVKKADNGQNGVF